VSSTTFGEEAGARLYGSQYPSVAGLFPEGYARPRVQVAVWGSVIDYIITAFTSAGQSAPTYWLGLLLIFYIWLDNPWTGQSLFPVGGIVSTGGQKTLHKA
jgi:hypothetical protein